jgi:hypothetical protein
MQCAACGAEATIGLRYCNRCGQSLINTNSLIEPAPLTNSSRFTGATWAVCLALMAITLGGFGILFGSVMGVLGIMTDGPNAQHTAVRELIPIVVPMIVFGMGTITFVDFMLIKLFTRLMNLPQEAARVTKKRRTESDEYRPAQSHQQPQLQAPHISVPSVTEHTTRNFAPIPAIEQKTRD